MDPVEVKTPCVASAEVAASIIASIDAARREAMDKGLTPNFVIRAPDADDDDADSPHVVG